VAKKRRQTKIPTPAWDAPHGALGSRVLGRGFQFYGAAVIIVLIAVALGVLGYAFWQDEAEKRGRPGSTAVQVDDTKYRLDYYSARLKIFVDQQGGQSAPAAQPTTALPALSNLLVREDLVRRFAGELDATASDEDIRAEIATRLGITADDASFDTVFEQELTRIGLTEEQYNEMIEAAVLENKLREHFTAELPETEEAINYRQIQVETQDEADDIVVQLEDGADFGELAAELSLDTVTKDSGGEVGWVARGIDPNLDNLVFDLEKGDVTTVPLQTAVIVIEVVDKDEARAIEEAQKPSLAAAALEDWINEKRTALVIVDNMDPTGGDADKISWAIARVYQS